MKKLLSLVTSLFLMVSCSSNDSSSNKNLEINQQNLLGKWFIKGETVNDGSFENHQHSCSKLKDYQEFLSTNSINFVEYNTNCEVNDSDKGFYFLDGTVLIVGSYDPIVPQDDIFTIVSITTEELKLKQTVNTPDGVKVYVIYLTRN